MAAVGGAAAAGAGMAIGDIAATDAANTAIDAANMLAKEKKKGRDDALALV